MAPRPQSITSKPSYLKICRDGKRIQDGRISVNPPPAARQSRWGWAALSFPLEQKSPGHQVLKTGHASAPDLIHE
jgi:hypothetical protein